MSALSSGLEHGLPLDAADHALIQAVRDELRRLYRPVWHTVAAGIRGTDGRIWTGIHLGTTVGRLSICAEAVALGRALIEGDGTAAVAVAVRHPKPDEPDRDVAVVSPCGACREMFADHAPDVLMIVPCDPSHDSGLTKLRLSTLLPLPYRR